MTTRWTVSGSDEPGQWILRADDGLDGPVTGDARRVVTAVEFQALRRLLEDQFETLTLHAALVARGTRGVVILGPNEAGKSTLACALWRHGLSLIGDDVAVIDTLACEARSAPRRVSLRLPSRVLLGESLWAEMLDAPSTEATAEGYVFHPRELDERSYPSVVQIAACIFLGRRGVHTAPGQATRIEPATAALALLPYSNLIRRVDAGTVIARVAPMADAVPAYDLGRGPIPEMIAAVERILDEG